MLRTEVPSTRPLCGLCSIATVAREHPRLVISDLRLPDGSGLDVVRIARTLPDPPSMIVVIGDPSAETRQAALAAGATPFLAKSFETAAPLALIRSSRPDGGGPSA